MGRGLDYAALFAHVEGHRDQYIARLIDYVRHPSISAHGDGMDVVADLLRLELERLGFAVELVSTPGWPVVVARRHDVPGAPTVLLYGHYDVQPPDPLDAWTTPPFEPTVRHGRLYARGVGDNKGQHFAQLLALETLLTVRGALPCNVTVVLEGEEEIGSPHLASFVAEHRDLLACDLVITADGPLEASGRACLIFGVRGVLSFELHARGANRDLHSGNFGGVAPNPLWQLVNLLATMKAGDGTITIDGFYDQVAPLTALERAALEALPVDEGEILRTLGLAEFDSPRDRAYYERLAAWPTLTINGLHGGYGGPGSKTVLPHTALAKCDIRLVARQTVESVSALLVAHVRRHAPTVELVIQGGMDPSKTPLDSPYAGPLRAGLMHARGEEPLLIPALGGSLPDYVFTRILGVPAFTVPYANADEANHAPNENLQLDLFVAGIRCGVAMLTEVGAMKRATEGGAW
jgi:acetylornithine deacetylase/succinyl-diaminopimelate desuccinylase-like protein